MTDTMNFEVNPVVDTAAPVVASKSSGASDAKLIEMVLAYFNGKAAAADALAWNADFAAAVGAPRKAEAVDKLAKSLNAKLSAAKLSNERMKEGTNLVKRIGLLMLLGGKAVKAANDKAGTLATKYAGERSWNKSHYANAMYEALRAGGGKVTIDAAAEIALDKATGRNHVAAAKNGLVKAATDGGVWGKVIADVPGISKADIADLARAAAIYAKIAAKLPKK